MKKTKIIATLGPASNQAPVLSKMVDAGLSVVRLNFSHGDHVEHLRNIAIVRAVARKKKVILPILQDLSGPKIRIGDFYQDRVMLTEGESFILTTQRCVGDEHHAFVNYAALPREIKPGKHILLDDGRKDLLVEKVVGKEIFCRIIIGGETKGRRGVNLPGTTLHISSLTAKDKKDLAFGLSQQVDFVALSFVRQAKDVIELRKILEKNKSTAKIIAKIETAEAIEHLDAILEATDGVMVARGDLAVEMPMEQVPVLQKRIVRRSRELGKPVIVATQMLESMIRSATPTRAEVNDVANAILDGADAVMLSEETTLGAYPVGAVAMMTRVALETERNYNYLRPLKERVMSEELVTDAVTHAVTQATQEIDARAIVALTESGFTPRMMVRHRPPQPVIVLSPVETTLAQVALSFGCLPIRTKPFTTVTQVLSEVRRIVIASGVAKKGDRIVIVGGVPFGIKGGTNMLLVETV